MASPAVKRQRTEEPTPVTRSEEFWHSDGSVVLQAENTQFRVHWGLLSLHSSFFRDLPQPPGQPNIDGCPIVELHDAVEDVFQLLMALYTPTFLSQTALPLQAIGALIRLGRKYGFKSLLNSAVERLTFENPSTLEEYDALRDPGTGTYKRSRIVDYPGLLFDIVELAQENNIMSVLPSAYYRLIVQDLDTFLDGVSRDDGTLASLGPLDLRRCIRGRERLLSAQLQDGYTCGWYRFWKPSNGCPTRGQCTKTLDARLHDHLDFPTMKAFAHFIPTAHKNNLFCATCKYGIREFSAGGRRRMWEELPGFFDLPPWNDLKNDL
ncbi:hypothetical protein DFH06DRAFT_1182184 [Mycena polygramma]|nr:hypothetical protein DFH06DRAFT_1182184 [Mycena polygramma]